MKLRDLGGPPAGVNVFDWILESSERARSARQVAKLPTPCRALDRAAMAQADAEIEAEELERIMELRRKYRERSKLPASATVEK